MIKEAIVLAGGLGTRLKGVINDIPKPMAPIGNIPFLAYLLSYLNESGVRHAILAVGYKYEVIEAYFGNTYKNIKLTYAVEHEPMGTGGGIANALKYTTHQNVFLLNGDTFFDVDLKELSQFHTNNNADLSLSLKALNNFDRYGTVEIDDTLVISFKEKQAVAKGFINGGVYVINNKLFQQKHLGDKFSFEQDIMEKAIGQFVICAKKYDGYFIDIGIPDDYKRANDDLPQRIRL